jgi:hypothetical protein
MVVTTPPDPVVLHTVAPRLDTAGLLAALNDYRPARQRLLAALGLDDSNRDPYAEFAEQLVAALTGGWLATSRVQAAWDVQEPDGSLTQVRYLANPGNRWVNEHLVRRIQAVTWYTLVLYEGGAAMGVVAFPNDLTAICAALGKRHPFQEETLQFTRRNWWAIRDNPDRFRALGARVWRPPFSDRSPP